ncbi:KR domain-containing protein [Sesbania bispinosa]|nr:KR domain-containing protein [Sesbania bispinosa]
MCLQEEAEAVRKEKVKDMVLKAIVNMCFPSNQAAKAAQDQGRELSSDSGDGSISSSSKSNRKSHFTLKIVCLKFELSRSGLNILQQDSTLSEILTHTHPWPWPPQLNHLLLIAQLQEEEMSQSSI